MLIRQEDNIKKIIHIDLTSTNWFNTPYYFIKQNDVLVVNPNNAKVKSAGIIGNTNTLISLLSIILTSVVLITK